MGPAGMLRLGKALASSSGHAWSLGRPDGAISRDMTLAHLRTLVAATDLPVNADFESGFGLGPQEVAERSHGLGHRP